MIEQDIKEAIGWVNSPPLQPDPPTNPYPDVQPSVTIHDFGRVLSENEPPPKQRR